MSSQQYSMSSQQPYSSSAQLGLTDVRSQKGLVSLKRCPAPHVAAAVDSHVVLQQLLSEQP
jgi:hypothetical protein